MCSSLYAYFLYTLGDKSYHPPSVEKIASNRLFGMYHSGTNDHIKDVVMKSLASYPGPLRWRRKGLVHTVCACTKFTENF